MFSAQTPRNQQMTPHTGGVVRYLELLVVREDGPRELGEHVARAGARRRASAHRRGADDDVIIPERVDADALLGPFDCQTRRHVLDRCRGS